MNKFKQQWFLICLVLVLAIGTYFAESLKVLNDLRGVRQWIVASVMFLMAWPLETSTMVATVKHPWPALLASVINLGCFPLVAYVFGLPLAHELALGLIVVGATPCTLASAAVWTRRAGGNDAVAIMTTVITNSLCFVVTPMWVLLLTSAADHLTLELSFGDMVKRLWFLVVFPMVLAQLTRTLRPVARWATRERISLSAAAQIGILAIVLFGAVQTGSNVGEQAENGLWILALLVILCGVLHLLILAMGFYAARQAGFNAADQIAVAFSSSQKTLMIGLVICIQLGVSLLPMVVYHAIQLVLDTVLADRIAKRGVESV